jgi:hypothetical protein
VMTIVLAVLAVPAVMSLTSTGECIDPRAILGHLSG